MILISILIYFSVLEIDNLDFGVYRNQLTFDVRDVILFGTDPNRKNQIPNLNKNNRFDCTNMRPVCVLPVDINEKGLENIYTSLWNEKNNQNWIGLVVLFSYPGDIWYFYK